MPKNNRHGKAAVWTPKVIAHMRKNLVCPRQRLIFEISLWTGERMGAIVQLQVSDVYDQGKVREYITFTGKTRKSSKHGQASTRQIFIHDVLKQHLSNYDPPTSGYLFSSALSSSGHITWSAVDDYWRKILTKQGYVGYSTHSSRRWIINKLHAAGHSIRRIAEAMAINPATVNRYLDDNSIECQKAIASLSI